MKTKKYRGILLLSVLALGMLGQATLSFAEEENSVNSKGDIYFYEDTRPELPVDPEDPDKPVAPEEPTDSTEGPLSIDYVPNFHFGSRRIAVSGMTYGAKYNRMKPVKIYEKNEAGEFVPATRFNRESLKEGEELEKLSEVTENRDKLYYKVYENGNDKVGSYLPITHILKEGEKLEYDDNLELVRHYVQVSDKRGSSGKWELKVKQDSQFTSNKVKDEETNEMYKLDGAVLRLAAAEDGAIVGNSQNGGVKPEDILGVNMQEINIEPGEAQVVMKYGAESSTGGIGTWVYRFGKAPYDKKAEWEQKYNGSYKDAVKKDLGVEAPGVTNQLQILPRWYPDNKEGVTLEVPAGANPQKDTLYETKLTWTLATAE